jgi:hypothetical protein
MIGVKITFDATAFRRSLDDFAQKQYRYARAIALTATAKTAVSDLQKAMRSDFSNPTNWTLNAFYAKPATKDDPTAYVAPREFAGKGTPGWKFLTPEIEGGDRRMKRFERRIGIGFLVPGTAADLDAYGNVARVEITRMLAQLNALADTAQNSNLASNPSWRKKRRGKGALAVRDARLERRKQFFLGKSSDGQLGIYRVVSTGHVARVFSVRPSAPSYSSRLPYWDILAASARANFPKEFNKALVQAWATARR